jgi:hypothetical protein
MYRNRPLDGHHPRAWRSFGARDGREIERWIGMGEAPRCPGCGEVLEAQPTSRLARQIVLGARGFDLDCRDCRRFWCMVVHTPRSLRLMRMRRLAAAVRAVRMEPTPESPPLPTA